MAHQVEIPDGMFFATLFETLQGLPAPVHSYLECVLSVNGEEDFCFESLRFATDGKTLAIGGEIIVYDIRLTYITK